MKYGQIIKPEDVVSLIKAGDLSVGTIIEVKPIHSDKWDMAIFCGFSAYSNDIEAQLKNGFSAHYTQARFPLPALKDGDPVCVLDYDQNWRKCHFKAFGMHNNIDCYDSGGTRWSAQRSMTWGNWRLPTKKELHDAGLDGWYDGRIELEEG